MAPIIAISLICIGLLIQFKLNGKRLYVIIEVFLELLITTIYWFVVFFALDTNYSCEQLGDVVCNTSREHRPHAHWLLMLIPGIIADLVFLTVFWSPVNTN